MKINNAVITISSDTDIQLEDGDVIANSVIKTPIKFFSRKDNGDNLFYKGVRVLAVVFRGISEFFYGVSYGYPICCIWAYCTNKQMIGVNDNHAVCNKCAKKILRDVQKF